MQNNWHRLLAILRLRCSHCWQSPVFAGVFNMHETCTVCGIKHEREEGFFMMSVFIGYCFYFVLLIPLAIWLYLWGLPLWQFMVVITLVSVVLMAPIFHYARVVWLHIDEWLDPRPEPGRQNLTRLEIRD